MQTGDIIFFKASKGILSRAISALTNSPYTHVAIALDDKYVLEADRFMKSRIRPIRVDAEIHSVFRVPNLEQRQMEAMKILIKNHEGYSYDYLQVFNWFVYLLTGWDVPLSNRVNKLICSELVDYILYYSDVPRNTKYPLGDVIPPMLTEAYDMEQIL